MYLLYVNLAFSKYGRLIVVWHGLWLSFIHHSDLKNKKIKETNGHKFLTPIMEPNFYNILLLSSKHIRPHILKLVSQNP